MSGKNKNSQPIATAFFLIIAIVGILLVFAFIAALVIISIFGVIFLALVNYNAKSFDYKFVGLTSWLASAVICYTAANKYFVTAYADTGETLMNWALLFGPTALAAIVSYICIIALERYRQNTGKETLSEWNDKLFSWLDFKRV